MNYLSDLLVSLVGIAFAMTIHEFGHAFAAYLLGDDTAKRAGRMTINPANHIDIVGLVMLMIFHFGWAKPVPVNPNNFKNYRVGNFIVSLAGAAGNLVGAIICALILKFSPMYSISIIAATALNYNLWFAAFNLLPVPPLVGWGVISSFLPYKFRDFEIKYENIGYLVLIVLLVTNLGSYITSPLVKLFWSIVVKVTGIY